LEYPLDLQIRQLLTALAVGVALALAYDLLRAVRRRLEGGAVTAAADVIFALLSGFTLFWLGMGPGNGALMWFMLAFAAVGFGLYMVFLSPLFLKILLAAIDSLIKFLAFLFRPLKIIGIKTQKIKKYCGGVFTNQRKRFTIISNRLKIMSSSRSGKGTGGRQGEVQKDKRYHEDRYRGFDNLRRGEPGDREEQDHPGAAADRFPAKKGDPDD
jgi:hypothetical protein